MSASSRGFSLLNIERGAAEMPSIVSIRASHRPGGRLTRTVGSAGKGPAGEMRLVRLDDGRALRVDAEAMASYGLVPGETIAADVLERMETRDSYIRAREMAVRLLAVRPRSTAELRARLRQRRVPDDQIRAVLDDLTQAGYLDDLAFARAWVTGRMASRPCGLGRLRWELRDKGIAPAMIEQAIREACGEEDLASAEERCARALAARRSSAYRRLAPEARMRRLAGFLQRRGFAAGTIAQVLRTTGWTGLVDMSEERTEE